MMRIDGLRAVVIPANNLSRMGEWRDRKLS